MKRVHKIMLVFSIIFWLLVVMGCILTGFALQKVPVNFYGLKVHYFSSAVDPTYYTSGLYYIDVGYNFVHFPRSKQYVIDQKVTVTNKNLQKITLTYTLVYRINPSAIYSLYNKFATNYQPHLLTIINNIIATKFTTLTQQDSRVSVQNAIVEEYNLNGRQKVSSTFFDAIMVEGIWINYLEFALSESYYQTAYVYTASSSESYDAVAYNLTMTTLEINALSAAITTSKDAFIKGMQLQAQIQYDSLISQPLAIYQQKLANISNQYSMSRILNYYPHVSFNFN